MHPQYHLFPSSCLLFMMVILSHVPTSLGDDNEQYLNCSQLFQCANIPDIGYPFWGGNRPEYCGHPSFELTNCQGGAPLITIESRAYRVLAIDNTVTTQSLKVVREEFWNTSCPTYLYNATLDFAHFTYASDAQNLTLHYGCQTPSNFVTTPNLFTCDTNGTISSSFYVVSSNNSTDLATCQTSVTVQVNQTAAAALALTSPLLSITQALDRGFGLQWQANNSLCNECGQSGGRCGSNSSSGSFVCYCADQPYSDACNTTQIGTGGGSSSSGTTIKIAIPIAAAVLAGVGLGWAFFACKQRRKRLAAAQSGLEVVTFEKKERLDDQNIEALIRHHGSLAPKRYRYSDVDKMTNSFEEKLGEGGYGAVYKGKLYDGCLVAVKLLSETKGNGEDFINEVASISRTSHVNVVALLGFCFERNRRALVYEFMAKGSLDKFIYSDESPSTNSHLEWTTLYQIAVGIARGLEYLHQGCTTRIVHFDIKPQNILLDEDFCPKISDFGLAKLGKRKQSIVSMLGARGTAGYIAPEVFSRTFGQVSHKSDVYSYGMLVLEMTGTRENVGGVQTSEMYFPDWIYEHLEHGKDLRLRGVNTREEEETVRKMILVGLWCIQINPSDRPPMSKVVEMLEGSHQSLQIPPKPVLFSPASPDPLDQDSSKSFSTINSEIEMLKGSLQSSQIQH